jgi:hypothetical protein
VGAAQPKSWSHNQASRKDRKLELDRACRWRRVGGFPDNTIGNQTKSNSAVPL